MKFTEENSLKYKAELGPSCFHLTTKFTPLDNRVDQSVPWVRSVYRITCMS